MEGSPSATVYEHVDSDDPWAAMASRRSLGGGTPGTPWDRSINGWVEVGWYLSPHALMRGMLWRDGEMMSRKQRK